VHSILDRSDNAEVAPAAAQAPVQVWTLAVIRAYEAAVGSDDVEGRDIVAGEAEAPPEAAEAATERQSRCAGVRNRARRGREPEGCAFVIELTEQRSGFEIRALCTGIHAHALHGLQIDDQPALARRFSGQAVPSRTHRCEQPVLACEVDGAPHVGGAGAAGDQRRMPVEDRVPDPASRIV